MNLYNNRIYIFPFNNIHVSAKITNEFLIYAKQKQPSLM